MRPSLTVDALANIAISPRRDKIWIGDHGVVIELCFRHAGSHLGSHREGIECFPPAPHADQIGAAVNSASLIVRRSPLDAVVSDSEQAERNVSDAQRADVAKVFF